MVQHVSRSARTSLRTLETAALRRIAPVLLRWWKNPLLRHARRAKPLPWGILRIALVALALSGAAAAILAWVNEWRLFGGLLMGLSFGAVVIPVVDAPVSSANRVAYQMQSPETDPRLLVDLDPREVAWGLALVTLWHLRWPILFGAAFTPALMIGVAHATVSDFRVWQESSVILGDATAASNTPYLRPDGEIPYFRLVLQALSAGLLPWAVLPLMAALGVAAALIVEEPLLSNLAALIGAGVTAILAMVLWLFLARTPLLAGSLEVIRSLLLALLLVMLLALYGFVTRHNAAWLSRAAAEGYEEQE